MERPRMLSGQELVAKGATRKADGQLPQVGLKDVTPNGSWLEQKQIQSALETRKHLIAVERIEKSGSLSHAEWRDDLKLAEVTKQAGGHWQYIGFKKGKFLYLLPEEALFLMEINSLLLKHNDVTVSLQKAYALCLGEMPLIQYKVYASLSRLGYRVLRHKEQKPIEKSNSEKLNEDSKDKVSTATEEIPLKSTSSVDKEDHICEITTNDMDHENSLDKNNEQTENNYATDVQIADNVEASNVTKEVNIIDDDSVKRIIEPNENKMETNGNSDSDTIKHDANALTNKIPPDENTKLHENKTNIAVEFDKSMAVAETEKLLGENKEESLKELTLDRNNDNKSSNDKAATEMDIENNATNDNVVALVDNKESTNKQDATKNETTNSDNVSGVLNSNVVYAVDDFGVIRVRPNENLTTTKDDNTISADANIADFALSTDANTNDSVKQYQVELQYYDEKIKRLIDKKSKVCNQEGLDKLQDLYKERIVNVNIPEEKYLPRNIFLHKAAYRLNMDLVSNQNASNVSSDEMDSVESPSPRVTNTLNQAIPPQYGGFNSNQPRFQPFRVERPQFYRQNFNYIYRPPIQNYFFHPRWRLSHTFIRNQYMAIHNMHTQDQANNRRDAMKNYHYNTILNIVARFKNGLLATPSQIRAVHNLLNTYNLRYNTNFAMTPEFAIIDAKNPPAQPPVQDVIVLDDEPKPKKPRLNDDNDKINTNLKKLKELAAKLKDLHTKNLAVSRHRRVFSNAIKTYNKSFNADLYLNSDFVIVDRKLVILDSSSDSEAVVVKEKEKPKKRKKLRNPYSILRQAAKIDNANASTSQEVPVLQTLSLNVINENASQNSASESQTNIASMAVDNNVEGLMKYFDKAWLPSEDDFGRAEACSKQNTRLDALLFQAEFLDEILKEPQAEFESWTDVKLYILRDMQGNLNIQKQHAEALNNDFYMETTSQLQPLLDKECTDLRTALKKLAIIPTNKEMPVETNLRIHFDVCNRDVPFKKSSPPKPNFRVVCYDESAVFPSSSDVAALQSKYKDCVPTVFAFVGISPSISYLQIKPIELPVFIPGEQT